MSKRRKKGRGKKANPSLSGIDEVLQNPYAITLKNTVLFLATGIAAAGAGAALGKHSLVIGIPLTLVGIHKKNDIVIAAGLGMTLSNGFQKATQTTSTAGFDGFDLKQIAAQAKDRVGTFFENFKEKLYLSKATSEPSSTNGLGEGEDEEKVTYFVNPYSNKELDMSAIDRVQEQIAKMQTGTSGLNEIDREF